MSGWRAEAAAHPAGTEDVAVGEELGAQVPDGQPRQHDLGAAVRAVAQLPVDDLPLRVHDGLVLARVVQPDLRPRLPSQRRPTLYAS